tara:strand:- start:5016 stop:5720 length:705 start_codon:yes stop_codon:yes gene_type:complete
MSRERFERDATTHAALFYPGTDVLMNLPGIRNAARLESAERRLVTIRMRQAAPPDARRLDYPGFLALHRHLFQDVYLWAGQERAYLTARGPTPFARPEHIRAWMEGRFARLREERYLADLAPRRFAERAAEHVNEINACHPFVEGNGRTLRAWLAQLADQAGFRIELSSRDDRAWHDASRKGFVEMDHEPMAQLIAARLSVDPTREEARRAAFLKSRAQDADKSIGDRALNNLM